MKLSLAILSVVPAIAAAKKTSKITADNLPNVDISAKSKTGGRILSKARRLDGDADADDTTWVAGYSLKFHSYVLPFVVFAL